MYVCLCRQDFLKSAQIAWENPWAWNHIIFWCLSFVFCPQKFTRVNQVCLGARLFRWEVSRRNKMQHNWWPALPSVLFQRTLCGQLRRKLHIFLNISSDFCFKEKIGVIFCTLSHALNRLWHDAFSLSQKITDILNGDLFLTKETPECLCFLFSVLCNVQLGP